MFLRIHQIAVLSLFSILSVSTLSAKTELSSYLSKLTGTHYHESKLESLDYGKIGDEGFDPEVSKALEYFHTMRYAGLDGASRNQFRKSNTELEESLEQSDSVIARSIYQLGRYEHAQKLSEEVNYEKEDMEKVLAFKVDLLDKIQSELTSFYLRNKEHRDKAEVALLLISHTSFLQLLNREIKTAQENLQFIDIALNGLSKSERLFGEETVDALYMDRVIFAYLVILIDMQSAKKYSIGGNAFSAPDHLVGENLYKNSDRLSGRFSVSDYVSSVAFGTVKGSDSRQTLSEIKKKTRGVHETFKDKVNLYISQRNHNQMMSRLFGATVGVELFGGAMPYMVETAIASDNASVHNTGVSDNDIRVIFLL